MLLDKGYENDQQRQLVARRQQDLKDRILSDSRANTAQLVNDVARLRSQLRYGEPPAGEAFDSLRPKTPEQQLAERAARAASESDFLDQQSQERINNRRRLAASNINSMIRAGDGYISGRSPYDLPPISSKGFPAAALARHRAAQARSINPQQARFDRMLAQASPAATPDVTPEVTPEDTNARLEEAAARRDRFLEARKTSGAAPLGTTYKQTVFDQSVVNARKKAAKERVEAFKGANIRRAFARGRLRPSAATLYEGQYGLPSSINDQERLNKLGAADREREQENRLIADVVNSVAGQGGLAGATPEMIEKMFDTIRKILDMRRNAQSPQGGAAPPSSATPGGTAPPWVAPGLGTAPPWVAPGLGTAPPSSAPQGGTMPPPSFPERFVRRWYDRPTLAEVEQMRRRNRERVIGSDRRLH
jgi:hypothetical protein